MGAIENHSRRIILFEGIGTMMLTYAFGCASLRALTIVNSPDAFLIACGLLAGLAFSGEITDAHFNPSVSLGAYLAKRTRVLKMNIIGQILGGVFGVLVFYACTGKAFNPIPDVEGGGVIGAKEVSKLCVNELVGGFFFTLCVLIITNKHISYAHRSWQVYLALPVALFLVRMMTGETTLNPVVAVPFNIMSCLIDPTRSSFLKTLAVLVPNLLGGILGGLVMRKFVQPILLHTKFHEQLSSSVEE